MLLDGEHKLCSTRRRVVLLVAASLLAILFSTLRCQGGQESHPQQPPPSSQAQGQPQQGQPQKDAAQKAESNRIDLGKFVGVATTPVGLIIAGAIAISFFQQKRIDCSAQVRALIMEMRKADVALERCQILTKQIGVYKARLKAIRLGTDLVATTIILFIVANVSSSLGLIFPKSRVFEVIVICGMLLGMLTLAASFATELFDSSRKQKELDLELADFDRIVEAGSRPPKKTP